MGYKINKNMQVKKESELGFTLMELIIVIAIIGIITTITVPIYKNYIHNSRDTAIIANVKTISSYINSVFIRCSTGEKTIAIATFGNIDCSAAGHHANISPMLTIFSNYFVNQVGSNPYNKTLAGILVSGQSQPTGTISLDYGRPDQCDGSRWCIRVIGWQSNETTINLIYSDKW